MKRSAAPAAVVLVLVGFAGTPVFAEPPSVVRTVNRVQALSRPSADGAVVATLEAGAVLEVVDSDPEWFWVVIPSDQSGEHHRGWIRAADAEAVPSPAPATESAPPRRLVMTGGIPPTGDEVRQAKKEREEQARVEQEQQAREEEQQARLETARLNLERQQQEYDEVVRRVQGGGADPAPPSAPAPAPASRSFQPRRSPIEFFGGYSLLVDTSDSLTFPVGWVAAAAGRLKNTASIVAEASGSYRSTGVAGATLASASIHTFAAGPRYSTTTSGVLLSGQVLVGAAITTGSVLGLSASSTGIVVEPGFGVDVPLSRGLAVRIGGELPLVRESGLWLNEFRMTAGLVVVSKQ